MTHAMVLTVIAVVFSVSAATASERRLHGQVLQLDEQNRRTPVKKNIKVVIDEIGTTEYTEDNGLFDYLLRDRDHPNKEITFRVLLDGYVVHEPLDGQIRIPRDSVLDNLIHLLLVKKGSKVLFSEARFEKSVEEATARANDQVKPGKDTPHVPVKLKLEEAASKLGFSVEEFRHWVVKSAAEQEESHSPKARARAAAVKGEFEKAADLEMQSMEQRAEAYARKRPKKQQGSTQSNHRHVLRLVKDATPSDSEDLEQLALELVKGFRFAGDAYYNAYQFEKALGAYQRALQYVDKEDAPELWAAIQREIGRASSAIGQQAEGAAIHQKLKEAFSAFKAALTIYTKEAFPQDWAKTQNNLGVVLREQGTRTSGEAGTQLLAQAVEAYLAALTVQTKEQFPQDWAATQNNLGNVLVNQGTRTSGKAGTQLLAQAVEAYRAALTFHTKEQLPQQWAATQNNLGIVLVNQGTRTSGEASTQLLAQAIEAYRAALTVRTKEQLPQQWATTQNNLGIVLVNQGTRTAGAESLRLLQGAEAAYREALTIFTKDQLPQGWVVTSSNLAEALFLSRQFATTRDHLAMLLDYPDLGPSEGVALRAIAIANSVALGTVEDTEAEFEQALSLLFRQNPDFFLTWDFSSIKTLIDKNPVFGNHRQWLLQLVETFASGRRDEMQAAIQTARDAFRKTTKP